MDTQHIKIGETYLLPVTVAAIEKDGWLEVTTYSDYVYKLAPEEAETLLQNGIKNTETAPKDDPYFKFRARAKRKNKIAQLKRSLDNHIRGNHLRGCESACYSRFQSLVRPGKKSPIAEWATYLNELLRIQEGICCAITSNAIRLLFDAERKEKEYRKKLKNNA